MFKVIYLFGAFISNKGVFKESKQLIRSDLFSKTKYVNLKNQKFHILADIAIRFSKFYGTNFLHEQIELENFEILYKQSLLEKTGDFITNFESDNLWVETSGTSGQTLYFPKGNSWDTKNRAALIRNYSWYNVNPWDRNGYFWGFEKKE